VSSSSFLDRSRQAIQRIDQLGANEQNRRRQHLVGTASKPKLVQCLSHVFSHPFAHRPPTHTPGPVPAPEQAQPPPVLQSAFVRQGQPGQPTHSAGVGAQTSGTVAIQATIASIVHSRSVMLSPFVVFAILVAILVAKH
jgi:hypothetical protein